MAATVKNVLVKLGVAATSLAIAGILIWFLVDTTGLSLSRLLAVLRATSPVYYAVLLVAVGGTYLLIVAKWQVVSRCLRLESTSCSRMLFVVSGAKASEIFMPAQLANWLVRSGSMKVFKGRSFRKESFATFYDVAFTLYAFFLLALISLALRGLSEATTWRVPCVVCILLLGAALPLTMTHVLGSFFRRISSRAGQGDKPAVGWLAALADVALEDRNTDQLLSTTTSRSLFSLSLLQACLISFQFCLVAKAGHFPLPLFDLFLSVPLIHFISTIGITPGGLGIVEWGWSGILILNGVEPAVACEFAIVSRLLIVSAKFLVFAMVGCAFLLQRSLGPRPEKSVLMVSQPDICKQNERAHRRIP